MIQYQCQLPPSSTEETSEVDMKLPTKAMEELVLSNLKIKEENKNLELQLQELQLENSKCTKYLKDRELEAKLDKEAIRHLEKSLSQTKSELVVQN